MSETSSISATETVLAQETNSSDADANTNSDTDSEENSNQQTSSDNLRKYNATLIAAYQALEYRLMHVYLLKRF